MFGHRISKHLVWCSRGDVQQGDSRVGTPSFLGVGSLLWPGTAAAAAAANNKQISGSSSSASRRPNSPLLIVCDHSDYDSDSEANHSDRSADYQRQVSDNHVCIHIYVPYIKMTIYYILILKKTEICKKFHFFCSPLFQNQTITRLCENTDKVWEICQKNQFSIGFCIFPITLGKTSTPNNDSTIKIFQIEA